MTASLTPPQATTTILASPARAALATSVEHMRRALDRVGSRRCAYELLDLGASLDQALAKVRAELRARHGEIPVDLRVELGALSRAATNADEFGGELTSIVPRNAPSDHSLIAHLDEWLRSAAVIDAALAELD
jgi:hypothetical protein